MLNRFKEVIAANIKKTQIKSNILKILNINTHTFSGCQEFLRFVYDYMKNQICAYYYTKYIVIQMG